MENKLPFTKVNEKEYAINHLKAAIILLIHYNDENNWQKVKHYAKEIVADTQAVMNIEAMEKE